jgi:hypothetical protein
VTKTPKGPTGSQKGEKRGKGEKKRGKKKRDTKKRGKRNGKPPAGSSEAVQ